MDWSRVPDLLAVASLACAFYSILKRHRSSGPRLWLIGWTLIVVHFICLLFAGTDLNPNIAGTIGSEVSLIAAGIFFMWATVPYRKEWSSRMMCVILLMTCCYYAVLTCLPSTTLGAFDFAATLISTGPLAVAVISLRRVHHTLRWLPVGIQFILGFLLVVLRHAPSLKPELCTDALLCAVYFGCSMHFWYMYRRGTAGSIITIGGFFAWSLVFAVGPLMDNFLPNIHLEGEVWNLPKYVVAVGMMLLLLENQIERSRYLALHDDLTKLANRRLFQDRLTSAMERCRRAGTTMALFQIDLDRFKEVNDTLGHHMGDLLLQHVAAQLGARMRRSDTVARTGGDEFSLILEETPSRQDAELIAGSLAEMLSEPFEIAGHTIQIGASIGVALYPDDANDAGSLAIAADTKMYLVKDKHRGNRHVAEQTFAS